VVRIGDQTEIVNVIVVRAKHRAPPRWIQHSHVCDAGWSARQAVKRSPGTLQPANAFLVSWQAGPVSQVLCCPWFAKEHPAVSGAAAVFTVILEVGIRGVFWPLTGRELGPMLFTIERSETHR
jgi:hypothetical protein